MAETYLFLGSRARVLLDGSATDGLFGLIEFTEAVGSQTPPHLHLTDTEIIYVLSGRTRVETEGTKLDLLPGTAHVLPADQPHRLSIPEVETRHLVLVTPGVFVDFVRAVSIPADASTPLRHPTPDEIKRVREVAGDYGIKLLPPESLHGATARSGDQPKTPCCAEGSLNGEVDCVAGQTPITFARLSIAPGATLSLTDRDWSVAYVLDGSLATIPGERDHMVGSGDLLVRADRQDIKLHNDQLTTSNLLLISVDSKAGIDSGKAANGHS